MTGILIATGSSGMAQAPDRNSTQPSIAIYFDTPQPAGTLVHIANGDTSILTVTSVKSFSCIVISSPDITLGLNYSLYRESSESSLPLGYDLGMDVTRSEHLFDITLSETITSVSETGGPPPQRRW